jgi:uncharacterized protein (TIGR02265 family)
MKREERISELVAHTDLSQRRALVPASAKLRGLYFKNNLTVLRREGLEAEFRELYPESHSAVRWYPVVDFLERLAVAGALLAGPANVHEGMRSIGENNAMAFAESLVGRAMLRLLARDPIKLLRQSMAGRRQSCTYGRWDLESLEPGEAKLRMYEEYLWLESNILGAATGTFKAVGVDVEVGLQLNSAFEGVVTMRWDPSR